MAFEPMKVELAPERLQRSAVFAQVGHLEEICCAPPGLVPLQIKLADFTLPSASSTVAGSPATSVCLSDDENDDAATGDTSVILKNIAPGCRREGLLQVLCDWGFLEQVNFMYLPMAFDKATAASFRYAFISFASPSTAVRFYETFTGFRDWGVYGKTVDGCTVEWCAIQGLDAHIQRYRNSPMMHESVPDEFKPMLLHNGVQVPFPQPTEFIKAPRFRRHKEQVANN